ncbi:MAG: hypothetical protein R6X33_00165 [Candidatus Brocadiia bacterium]
MEPSEQRIRRMVWEAVRDGRISVHQAGFYEAQARTEGFDLVAHALETQDAGKFHLATRRLTPEEERAAHLHGIEEDRFAAALVYLEAGEEIRRLARQKREEQEQHDGA